MKCIRNFLAAAAAYLASIGTFVLANLYSQKTYDNQLLLKAAAAVGASADGSLILDVGNGVMEGDLVIDVTAITVTTADQSYRIVLEGSPDATFGTAGNIATVAEQMLGHATAIPPQGFSDVVGRFLIPCRNERNGTTYRYLRIRTVVAGTVTPSITYSAWLAKR